MSQVHEQEFKSSLPKWKRNYWVLCSITYKYETQVQYKCNQKC